jgi:Flp pilus assembly protein CpaB
MKWGIVILLILGVVAAACAAVLMGVFSIGSSGSANAQSADIEVAMARTSLPAMTVITLNHIIKEKIARVDLPQGQVVSPARAIGRVLTMPVMEGQVLTDSCFVAEGAGSQLAAAIPHGMRAVTVSVSSKSMPDSILLYPGCVVDVLVAYRLSTKTSEGQALSTTMLRGIQVIAVAGDSVISNPDVEGTSGTKKRITTSRGTLVTLLVDTKQAEALLLAIENGNLSLSVRNPLDKEIFELEGTVLSQGRLAHLGSMLTPTVLSNAQNERDMSMEQQLRTNNPQDPAQSGLIYDPNIPAQQPQSAEKYEIRQSPRWGVTVIRGSQTKVEEFETSESEAGETTAKK